MIGIIRMSSNRVHCASTGITYEYQPSTQTLEHSYIVARLPDNSARDIAVDSAADGLWAGLVSLCMYESGVISASGYAR